MDPVALFLGVFGFWLILTEGLLANASIAEDLQASTPSKS
jgi:hypothetical protein